MPSAAEQSRPAALRLAKGIAMAGALLLLSGATFVLSVCTHGAHGMGDGIRYVANGISILEDGREMPELLSYARFDQGLEPGQASRTYPSKFYSLLIYPLFSTGGHVRLSSLLILNFVALVIANVCVYRLSRAILAPVTTIACLIAINLHPTLFGCMSAIPNDFAVGCLSAVIVMLLTLSNRFSSRLTALMLIGFACTMRSQYLFIAALLPLIRKGPVRAWPLMRDVAIFFGSAYLLYLLVDHAICSYFNLPRGHFYQAEITWRLRNLSFSGQGFLRKVDALSWISYVMCWGVLFVKRRPPLIFNMALFVVVGVTSNYLLSSALFEPGWRYFIYYTIPCMIVFSYCVQVMVRCMAARVLPARSDDACMAERVSGPVAAILIVALTPFYPTFPRNPMDVLHLARFDNNLRREDLPCTPFLSGIARTNVIAASHEAAYYLYVYTRNRNLVEIGDAEAWLGGCSNERIDYLALMPRSGYWMTREAGQGPWRDWVETNAIQDRRGILFEKGFSKVEKVKFDIYVYKRAQSRP